MQRLHLKAFDRFFAPRLAPDARRTWMGSGLCVTAFLLYLLLITRNAWLSDDGFVAFRAADNLLTGHGLTYNATERVQAFTNPAWTLLLAVPYGLSHEIYASVIATSILCSSLAVALMGYRLAVNGLVAALGILLCGLSEAFVDFSTSGLENPLTFLLLALFFTVYFTNQGRRRVFWLCLFAALLGTNRLDLLFIILPPLAYALEKGLAKEPWRSTLVQAAIGALPLVAWELFAFVYYGFPLPNTAYAKLNTDISGTQFASQGLLYLIDSFCRDPVTLLTILFAVVFAFVRSPVPGAVGAAGRSSPGTLYHSERLGQTAGRTTRRRIRSMLRIPSAGSNERVAHDPERMAVALGVVLYMAYVVRIGGDFMAGRMLTGPLFVSVILLVRCLLRPSSARTLALLAGSAAFIGFGLSVGPWKDQDACIVTPGGIVNERVCYQDHTALVFNLHEARYKQHGYYRDGLDVARAGTKVDTKGAVGMTGFAAGPGFHLVNDYALSEPLLARLRHRSGNGWRIGHLLRPLPDGYRETLETGKNVIVDPCVREFYNHLRLVIRGPVFSWERLKTVVAMNLGRYNYLLEPECSASRMPTPPPSVR
jgi:arabinofuranosyltransferase